MTGVGPSAGPVAGAPRNRGLALALSALVAAATLAGATAATAEEPPMAAKQQGPERAKTLSERGVTGIEFLDASPFGPAGVERWRLANGLQLLLAPDPASPVVAVHTWVKVGSADEVAGKTGLAHLLEHAMFKSTTTRPAGTFDRALEQHGASANAATWFDWTMYHEVVPPSQVATVFELEADRLAHLDLSAHAVRSELEVVRNERREEVDDDPDSLVVETLWNAAFGKEAYGHPVIGTSADLAGLQVGDVVDFYRARYVPENTAVVVTGGFDPTQVLTDAAKWYGGLAARPAPKRSDKPASEKPKSACSLVVDAGSGRLAVAWRTVPMGHADHPALALLAEVLAGSDSSRLYRQMVEQSRVASSVSASQTDLRLGGLLEIYATLRPGKTAAEAEALLLPVLADLLAASPVSQTELDAARNRMKTQHLRELASADGRADVLGRTWASGLDLGVHQRWWQAIDRATTADVQAAAGKWLKSDLRTVLRADPPVRTSRARSQKGRAG